MLLSWWRHHKEHQAARDELLLTLAEEVRKLRTDVEGLATEVQHDQLAFTNVCDQLHRHARTIDQLVARTDVPPLNQHGEHRH